MRKVSMFVAAALVTAVAALPVLAGDAAHAAHEKGKTHEVTSQVLSVDAKAHTVTLDDGKGGTMTVKVMGKAVAELASLKPGKYTMTCQDNAKGEHEGVTAFKAAM